MTSRQWSISISLPSYHPTRPLPGYLSPGLTSAATKLRKPSKPCAQHHMPCQTIQKYSSPWGKSTSTMMLLHKRNQHWSAPTSWYPNLRNHAARQNQNKIHPARQKPSHEIENSCVKLHLHTVIFSSSWVTRNGRTRFTSRPTRLILLIQALHISMLNPYSRRVINLLPWHPLLSLSLRIPVSHSRTWITPAPCCMSEKLLRMLSRRFKKP